MSSKPNNEPNNIEMHNLGKDEPTDEETTSATAWSRARRRFPFLAKIQETLEVLFLFATNLVMVAVDVGSDIYTAIALYNVGHYNWSIATFVPIFLPFLVSGASQILGSILRTCNGSIKEQEKKTGKWSWPIWHLPGFQLVNHYRLTLKIYRAIKERNQRLYDLENLTSFKFVGKDLVQLVKKHCVDRTLRSATENLSLAEGEFLTTKLLEAVLENGPQFILQLAIIIKVGNIEGYQAAAMLSSFFSFWYSLSRFYLQMPTKKTPLRSAGMKEHLIPAIPIIVITLTRLVTWSFIMAYFNAGVLLPVFLAFIALWAFHWKDLDYKREQDFVELAACILAPCVAKDEYSKFYTTTSATTTVVLWLSAIGLLLVSPSIDSNPPITTCFSVQEAWIPGPDQVRCLYNETLQQQQCTEMTVTFGAGRGFEDYRTVCQPGQTSQSVLIKVIGCLIGALFLSLLLSIVCIQPYLDPVKRLRAVNFWNDFYQTKSIHVLKVFEAGEELSDQFVRRLFLSAVHDNLDSLVLLLMDKYKSQIMTQPTLQTALSVNIVNHEIKETLASNLSDLDGEDGAQLKLKELADMEVSQSLDLMQVKASINALKNSLNSTALSSEATLRQLVIREDVESIKHVLNYHSHLSTKLLAACKTQSSMDQNRLAKAMLGPFGAILEQETTATEASSVIQIQVNHHLMVCQETLKAQTQLTFREDFRNNGEESSSESIQPDDNREIEEHLAQTQEKLQRLYMAPFWKMILLATGFCILVCMAFIGFLFITGNSFGFQPKSCTWTQWSEWSDCSRSCGPGSVKARTRDVTLPAFLGGRACIPGEGRQASPCNKTPAKCPRGVNFMRKEFLDSWQLEVNYNIGDGKALIIEVAADEGAGAVGYKILDYIDDMDHSFDFQMRQWQKNPRQEFETADATGHYVEIPTNAMLYIGPFLNGTMAGTGTVIAAHCTGSSDPRRKVCQGRWNNKGLDGPGTCTFCCGASYNGWFRNNTEDGQGTYILANGRFMYAGDFHQGKRDGHGRFMLRNEVALSGPLYEYYFDGPDFSNDTRFDWPTDGTYSGDWRMDQIHGRGKLRNWIGETYEGDFIKGTRTGHGKQTWQDGKSYTGYWFNNVRHGLGITKWPNWEVYLADILDGILLQSRDGDGEDLLSKWPPYGVFTGVSAIDVDSIAEDVSRSLYDVVAQSNNIVYSGTYANGVKHGQGSLTLPKDLGVYEGDWENDTMTGRGRFTWPRLEEEFEGWLLTGKPTSGFYRNKTHARFYEMSPADGSERWTDVPSNGYGQFEWRGNVYIGQFRNGRFHGNGTLVWAGGKSNYTGEFEDGELDGMGTLQTENFVYTGSFKDNKLDGNGTMKSEKGTVYIGEFENGQFHGRAHYFDSDGNNYVGGYSNTERHGNGTFTFTSGSVYSGQWEDNYWNGYGHYCPLNLTLTENPFRHPRIKIPDWLNLCSVAATYANFENQTANCTFSCRFQIHPFFQQFQSTGICAVNCRLFDS